MTYSQKLQTFYLCSTSLFIEPIQYKRKDLFVICYPFILLGAAELIRVSVKLITYKGTCLTNKSYSPDSLQYHMTKPCPTVYFTVSLIALYNSSELMLISE